jgi:hypothetical protein
MREHKYRAWHEGAKQMLFEDRTGDVFKWKNEGQPVVIMEALGIISHNGKDIYDGDIVLTDEAGWIAQVVWTRDGFMCIKKDSGFSQMCNWEDFEVLGNIYQNPELLGGEPVFLHDIRMQELNCKQDFTHFKEEPKC